MPPLIGSFGDGLKVRSGLASLRNRAPLSRIAVTDKFSRSDFSEPPSVLGQRCFKFPQNCFYLRSRSGRSSCAQLADTVF
jgi:hypothetical protein